MKLLEQLEAQLNGTREVAAAREERISNADVEWTRLFYQHLGKPLDG